MYIEACTCVERLWGEELCVGQVRLGFLACVFRLSAPTNTDIFSDETRLLFCKDAKVEGLEPSTCL